MFRLRQARPSDLDALHELARTGNFINLPPFRDRLEEMIAHSDRSFHDVAAAGAPPADHDRTLDNYMLVLEAPDGAAAGTSAIRGGMIARGHPNLSYQLLRVVRASEVLARPIEDASADAGRQVVSGRMEHIHAVLFQDEALPTEIGGNVLRHDARGHGLGKLLSYARFHLLKAHAAWFSDRLLAEMMAPVDGYNDGTPFWRHVIRRFIDMTYDDADRLSTHRDKREFMYALLPRLVNLSLLPESVLDSLGQIARGTQPAAEMLRDIGFRDTHRVDPFDAGPHLEMRLSELRALACTPARRASGDLGSGGGVDALVSAKTGAEGFVAVRTFAALDDNAEARLAPDGTRALGVGPADPVMISPMGFKPDRHPAEPIPEIELHREMERRRARVGADRLASMTVSDMAQIIEDKLATIARDLADDRPSPTG